jgi:hypothetical protein
MRLRQGQLWDLGNQYVRIVLLERLAVEYKAMKNHETKEGTHHHATKKEFCALVKNAILVPAGKTKLTSESDASSE